MENWWLSNVWVFPIFPEIVKQTNAYVDISPFFFESAYPQQRCRMHPFINSNSHLHLDLQNEISYLSIILSIYLSICLSSYPFIHPSIFLCTQSSWPGRLGHHPPARQTMWTTQKYQPTYIHFTSFVNIWLFQIVTCTQYVHNKIWCWSFLC